MVMFEGRRSKKVLRFIQLENCKFLLLIFGAEFIMTVATLIAYIVIKDNGFKLLLASSICLLILIIFMCCFCLSKRRLNRATKAEYNNLTTVRITEQIFDYKFNNQKYETKTSNIRKVYDFGEWYEFYFNFFRRHVCQKDWIIEGTIEEFEAMFKTKLVDKTKNRKSK